MVNTENIFKNFINHLIKAVLLLVCGIAAGYVLLMLAYLLPVEPICRNLSQSTDIQVSEREYHRVIPGYVSTQLDNYTDSWMMGNAAYDSQEVLWKRALTCASADYNQGPLDGLVRYLDGEDGYQEITYKRYWHGYLIVLKPFFMFFDYADLRFVNLVLELLLVIAVFGQLVSMGYRKEAWCYIISVIFIMPIVIPLSIQFSVVFYITNIASLILLKNYDFIKDRNYMLLYFQLIGMSASYFDFLTYPAASLGVPLVCLMLLESDKGFKDRLKDIICLSVSWGFGYGAMWAGKWILSTIILNDNVIADALAQITMRSSHIQEGERITVIDTWIRNVEFYFEKPYLIFAGVCAVITIAGIIRIAVQHKISNVIADVILFMIIAAIPFAWYMVTGQHSYEHHWFTFRALMATVFACMCIFARVQCEKNF